MVGDCFGVFAREVGEHFGEMDAAILLALKTGHRDDEGGSKGLQEVDRTAEGGRRNLTIGEQFLLAELESMIHDLTPFHLGGTPSGRY